MMIRRSIPRAVAAGLDFYLDDLDARLLEAGVGLMMTIDDRQWRLGPEPARAAVTLSAYEAFRAIGGRRTRVQLLALRWSGDSGAVVDLLSAYTTPEHDLA
jgi:hypothetical protein